MGGQSKEEGLLREFSLNTEKYKSLMDSLYKLELVLGGIFILSDWEMEFASSKATVWQIEEIKVEYYADCRQKLWKQ